MNVIEKHYPTSKTLVLLLHGQEASSADWVEKDGFTKGGNLTDRLDVREISWMAHDLYGHGDFSAQEADFNAADISDELWPVFLSRSADACTALLKERCAAHGYEHLMVITYSAGCHVAVELLHRTLPVPVQHVYMAVPNPEREYDDEYSLHNNLDCFRGRRCCFFAGAADEEVPVADVRWLYEQFDDAQTELLVYESGHSLPEQWTEDAVLRIVSRGN